MRFLRIAPGLALIVSLTFLHTSVQGSFHQWRITEFFSNDNGTVQFIELYSPANGENFSTGAQIRSNSSPATPFTFPGPLASSLTGGKRLLIATSNFASLAGAITPDYATLPANFFNATGDTVRLYAPAHGEFHSRTIASVPIDGINSLHFTPPTYASSVAGNMPTNFAGMSGSVNLSIPPNNGDYNGDLTVNAADYTVWRNSFGTNVAKSSGADGNNNSMIDFGDYTFWKSEYGKMVDDPGAGHGALASVPEPTTLAMALAILGYLSQHFDRRSGRRTVRK